MPDDHEQIVVRRRKLDALRERGVNPYPNDFRPDHTAEEVQARFGPLTADELATAPSVAVAARVVAFRDFGKAGFLQLQEGDSCVQVHARQDRLPTATFEVYRLLAKALHPLPEKWHGLQDVEMRYRQRYLDLIVNPEVRRTFSVRSRVIRHVRDFLEQHGYIEVETPIMQPIAGGAAAR